MISSWWEPHLGCRVTDPKAELAFAGVSAVPATGANTAPLLAGAVQVFVTQVLSRTEAMELIHGAFAQLYKDSRHTLEEAGSGAALPGRGTLFVIRALIRNHLAAGPVVWWAAPQFVSLLSTQGNRQLSLQSQEDYEEEGAPDSHVSFVAPNKLRAQRPPN